jgi:hypothetical protein
MTDRTENRKRWLSLYVLCAGVLMIVLANRWSGS